MDGFQVTGSSGVLQIDGTYFNHLLVAKGRAWSNVESIYIGTGNRDFYIDAWRSTVSFEAEAPLFLIAPNECAAAIIKHTRSGSTWTVEMMCDRAGYIDWWVLDKGNTLSSGWGMQVFGANGQLVFDAQRTPPRVLRQLSGVIGDAPMGYIGGGPYWPSDYSREYPFDVGRVAVGCILTPKAGPYGLLQNGGRITDLDFSIGGWRCAGGSALFTWFHYDIGGHFPNKYFGFGESLVWNAVVFDVTNT